MAVERLVLRALRKEDFLDLTFELVNVHAEGEPPRLVRSVAGEPALLIVHFPPQHLAEEAFPQDNDGTKTPGPAPVRAMLSGPSRLVFMLPEEEGDWSLSLATLLNWRAYSPVLAPNALPPGATSGPGIAQPTPEQTALELPTGVFLSPDATGGWAHATQPVEHDGRFELWHTRLGARQPDGNLREDLERFVRAIWTSNPVIPFLNGLTPADRVDIVRLSSDFSLPMPPLVYGNNPFLIARWRYQLERAGLPRKYVPRPIGARHLMLSGLGAWTSLESAWDYPTILPGQNDGLGYPQMALEQWQHIAAQGRDQFVKTVQKAFLCDVANRASIVTITEREFHPLFIRTDQTPQGPVGIFGSTAFLRQYQYVEVQEPIKDYRPLAAAYRYDGREMPFKRVHITTRSTPKLDTIATGNDVFWPMVSGKPFPFEMLEDDGEGKTTPVERPLLVVPLRAVATAAAWQNIVNQYNAQANLDRRTAQTGARPVAFAETTAESRGKTTLATDAVVSEAQLVQPAKVTALPSGHPQFLPTIRSAQVGIPAVERLLGRPTAVEIVFDPVYLANGFTSPSNKGEVFANLAYKLDLPFGAEKGGGLIKPDTSIQALSRSLGPVANATAIKQGTFDTSMFDKARFLGGITLRDILTPVPFSLDNVKAADLPLPELEARLADPGFRLEVPMLTSRPIYPDGVNPNDPAAKPVAAETRFLWKPVVPRT